MLELKQKITLKTYRGHIRNHAELCKELDVSPLLSREDMEKEIRNRFGFAERDNVLDAWMR